MLLADVATIRDVVLFPTLRPEQDQGTAPAPGDVAATDDPDRSDDPVAG
jgi:hypothetical protein